MNMKFGLIRSNDKISYMEVIAENSYDFANFCFELGKIVADLGVDENIYIYREE